MAKRKEAAQTVSAGKREAILSAALAAFLESGYAATSMDTVAGRAGVSKATVYAHFNSKDELQTRWAHRLCHRHVELPRHALPSPQAFVTATLAGMGWGLHPQALIAAHLEDGSLVELVPGTPLDVPLHWQHARSASSLLDGLTRRILAAAHSALIPY